jgi:hypothetical protein
VDQRKYLYHARIDSHLSLEQIGMRTALSPTVLRNLDEGRFELLPSGVYARSYVRTFAAAVGLDPEAAIAELELLLPGAPDPLPVLNARRHVSEWPVEFVIQLVVAIADQLGRWKAAVSTRTSRVKTGAATIVQQIAVWIRARRAQETSGVAAERIREFSQNDLADRLLAGAALLIDRARRVRINERLREVVSRLHAWPGLTRCGAAAIDALLLMIVDGFLVCLISWSSGIPITLLLREAGWALGAFCAIPIALYFLLFGGIAGSTLGGYLCSLLPSLAPVAPDEHDRHHPLTLPDILRRAVRR